MARIGQELNRTQAAAIFGVAELTIDAWRRAGLPSRKVGRLVKFNSKAVSDWLVERARAEASASLVPASDSAGDDTLLEAQRRRAVAEARLAELKLGQIEGGLVSIEDWQRASEDLVAHIRQGMMTMPYRLATTLAIVAANANTVELELLRQLFQEKLDEAIREVLTDLAKPPESWGDDDEAAEPSTDPAEEGE